MHWIFVNIYDGINNVYSGWIWWNLFLAFIPMLLSFFTVSSAGDSSIPAGFGLVWDGTDWSGGVAISNSAFVSGHVSDR